LQSQNDAIAASTGGGLLGYIPAIKRCIFLYKHTPLAWPTKAGQLIPVDRALPDTRRAQLRARSSARGAFVLENGLLDNGPAIQHIQHRNASTNTHSPSSPK
jgi:hypothetical protein